MLRKVLFLLDSYFPEPSPNAICVKKISHQLLKLDVKPICIVLDNVEKSQLDLIEGVDVYRIKLKLLSRLINKYHYKDKINSIDAQLVLQLSRIQGAIYGVFWPLLSVKEVFRYYFKAKDLIEKEKVNIVISVYKRIEGVLAGVLLKMKYPELEFVVYTLDCMSRSLVPKILNTDIAQYSVKRWERFIFSKADYICIMQSHQKHYQKEEYKRFANKFVVMDIPLFELKDKESQKNETKISRTVKMVFTGSMSEITANPIHFIKTLEKIEDVDFVFDIYGGTSSIVISQNIKNSHLFGKKLFWHGVVPPEIAAQKQKEADILISFGNDNECMIPSKIFEYIALKKQIIHLFKSDSDSALPYFKKYGNATLIKEKYNINSDNSQKVKDLLMNIPDVKIDDCVLLEKFYNNTAEPMADFIISLLKK